MPQENLIGEFLRARRELVRPEDVGISERGGRRRVAGLRREEVAMLAGVCNDYYVRLEQGRDQNPSPQVLDALAQVLQLDDDATDHLHRLANPPTRRRRDTAPVTEVPAGILELLASSQNPAYVHGRYLDVLAANPAGAIPQAERFWSLTAYIPPGITLVPNAAQRYAVAAYTPGLQTNPDGSITIYIQHNPPAQTLMPNWLPVPQGPFSVLLRVYGPQGNTSSSRYVPPGITSAPGVR